MPAEARAQPLDRVGRVVRRQQAGLAAQQRRAEADREAVAVADRLSIAPVARQPRGQRARVGEELAARVIGGAVAPGERGVEVAGAEQRRARRSWRPASAGVGRGAARLRRRASPSASVARSNSGCSR